MKFSAGYKTIKKTGNCDYQIFCDLKVKAEFPGFKTLKR